MEEGEGAVACLQSSLKGLGFFQFDCMTAPIEGVAAEGVDNAEGAG